MDDWKCDDEEWRRLAKTGSEDGEQMALMGWAARQIYNGNFPALSALFAVPNGGERNIAVAGKLKATGVKAGVPDLFLPVARAGKFGLFIEMKKAKAHGGGKVAPKQIEWRDLLWSNGYGWALCYGWEEAREVIVQYLTAPETRAMQPGSDEYGD